jgi:hypothetical protein
LRVVYIPGRVAIRIPASHPTSNYAREAAVVGVAKKVIAEPVTSLVLPKFGSEPHQTRFEP